MFKLAERLHISQIHDLCDQLKSYLGRDEAVKIDASAVEHIDTASMQVLCALQQQLQAVDHSIQWVATSAAFQKSASLLGLTEFLKINS